MHWIDWAIVIACCAMSLTLGLLAQKSAGKTLEAYFTSNRGLGWWLAGTSIAATAFSADTPLLITGMVRRKGVWGVWEVWALGISTMLAVFVFSKLWKRAGVMTEVELSEKRYSGKPAAFLRGFKAIYWGLFYNCFIMGVWVITGMSKVLQEVTGLPREWAIVGCVALGAVYTSMAGLLGVVITDAFQFIWAMTGAVVLAIASVKAVGGLDALTERLAGTSVLSVLPPGPAQGETFLASPLGWFAGLVLVQWWAWKNTDGGGVIVQRLVSCKDERQSMLSVLWFNVAHYCLRSWPWVITALASLILIPQDALVSTVAGRTFVDHERAYPHLINQLLPTGWRGFLVASFFAAFLSTLSKQLNWGASYLVHDVYQRFLRKNAPEAHYVRVARTLPYALAAGAMLVAWQSRTIGESFTWILNLTAGIGPVFLLRWFWWRINPWSEIAAMAASLPVLLCRAWVFQTFGLPAGQLPELLYMVLATAAVWLPITLLTPAVDRGTLKQFYAAAQPPGFWREVAIAATRREPWRPSLSLWIVATAALLAATVGPIQLMLGRTLAGGLVTAAGAMGWALVWKSLKPGGVTRGGINAASNPSRTRRKYPEASLGTRSRS